MKPKLAKNNADIASKFVDGEASKYGNVECDAGVYKLFGHAICRCDIEQISGEHKYVYRFDWCDHYTRSTARHINNILKALNANHRVSYAQARDAGVDKFVYVAG